MDGRPWAEWKGKPITPHAIARLLRPFGIKPQDQLRIGQRNSSGYEAAAFEDAFNRYFRSNPPPATPTTPTALKQKGSSENQTPTANSRVGVRNGENTNGINGVGIVGLKTPLPGERMKLSVRLTTCRPGRSFYELLAHLEDLAQARAAGVIVELDTAGNLRLRSPNEPPQAMVEHLRSHKDEIVAFLRGRAEAERAESRLVEMRNRPNESDPVSRKACARTLSSWCAEASSNENAPTSASCARSGCRDNPTATGLRLRSAKPPAEELLRAFKESKDEILVAIRDLPTCCECRAVIVKSIIAWWGGDPVHLACGEAAWRRIWKTEAGAGGASNVAV